MEYKVPETWDWIKARAGCSAKQMFGLLVERIESDVKQIQQMVGSGRITFTLNRVSDSLVIVARSDDLDGVMQSDGVRFERTDTGVAVVRVNSHGHHNPLFMVIPSVDLDGRCRFHTTDQAKQEPLELWQVSHRSLEELFFRRWRE
jgi:hypothetical protein